jgi:DNA polymerase I
MPQGRKIDRMENKLKILLVIDSNSIIHRAFHALPPLSTKKGELVNAVYGFLLVFLKAIKDFRPDFIAAAFDFPASNFRHEEYKEYKAKRPKTPEDLSEQIPKVKEILKAFKVPVFEKQGFEADDIIGTIAEKAGLSSKGIGTIILSGDSDVFQLVDSRTKVYFLKKGVKDIVLYDEKRTAEKFQSLVSEQILDFKALRGDPSDNIPGVRGIGEKTAFELLRRFGSLENIYKELENDSEKAKDLRPKLKEILRRDKDQAFLSRRLAAIRKDVEVDFDFNECRWLEYDEEEVLEILKKWGFNSLVLRLLKNNRPGRKEEADPGRKTIQEKMKLW